MYKHTRKFLDFVGRDPDARLTRPALEDERAKALQRNINQLKAKLALTHLSIRCFSEDYVRQYHLHPLLR